MGKHPRYTDEFKQEAVNQVVVHGYLVLEVSKRLGIANKSLYDWIKVFSKPQNNVKKKATFERRTLDLNVNSSGWNKRDKS